MRRRRRRRHATAAWGGGGGSTTHLMIAMVGVAFVSALLAMSLSAVPLLVAPQSASPPPDVEPCPVSSSSLRVASSSFAITLLIPGHKWSCSLASSSSCAPTRHDMEAPSLRCCCTRCALHHAEKLGWWWWWWWWRWRRPPWWWSQRGLTFAMAPVKERIVAQPDDLSSQRTRAPVVQYSTVRWWIALYENRSCVFTGRVPY